MKKSFRLVNAQVAQNCFKAIQDAVADNLNTPHNVVVTVGLDDDKARSLAQNRLYWGWLHELKQQTGQDSDDLHIEFKRRFLARIYARDDGEFAEMANAIKACKGVISDEHYEQMATGVIKRISTTTANTKQFSEYLGEIEVWAYSQGLTVTIPQELEWAR